MKIGIVGHGFVGKAVEYGFSHPEVTLQIVDPKYNTTVDDLSLCDIVFICVPTPMGDNGTIDSSILEGVMDSIWNTQGMRTLVVIKSTITPDLASKYERPGVVYNPEFLREKSAAEDFITPNFHVFGGFADDVDRIEDVYRTYSLCQPCPTFKTSAKEASFIKYAINSFLAMKVTFFNQLYDTVTHDGSNYTTVANAVGADPRIGYSHTRVPGFDGKKGFGGSCFPKDTSALVGYTDKMSLIDTVISINSQYRTQYELDEREKQQNVTFIAR